MRNLSLMALRVTMGALMLVWGIDKLVNVEHAMQVSNGFYLGLFSGPTLLNAFGIFQVLLGLLVIVGLWRRLAYPALILINLVSLVGVWRSILDPWGWYLERTNALFFPSVIITAAGFVLLAFQAEDRLSLDERARK